MTQLTATIENIVSLYLYGVPDVPDDLRDRFRDLPADATIDVSVNTLSYMATVGRYATPARAGVPWRQLVSR